MLPRKVQLRCTGSSRLKLWSLCGRNGIEEITDG
jgi:hypothetical protein